MKQYESIGRYISYLYRMGQCYINKKLEPYNIGSGQFAYLMVLYKEDGLSQEELSEKIMTDKATTGRAIKKLVEEGYVYRNRSPLDKRSYQLHLTDKAISLKPIIVGILQKWNELLLDSMEDHEKELGIEVIKKMVENVSHYKRLK